MGSSKTLADRAGVAQVIGLATLALLTASLATPRTALGSERALTIDDLLKVSQIGRAVAQPGGETFVWEQSPPYDALNDYGLGDPGTWQGSNFHIFTLDPRTTQPTRLFHPHDRTTYRVGDFSAGGRFLPLLSMSDGRVRLAVYDFRRHRLSEYPVAPRLEAAEPDPDWAWVDNHHLAVAAYPAGSDGPWPLTFRRALGRTLTRAWEKSWEGKVASVDRYDSSSTDISKSLPGRLLLVDTLSGQIQQLASGQFAGLRPSPDGHWLAAVRQSSLPQSTLEHPHVDWTYARSTLVMFSVRGKNAPGIIAPELDALPDSMKWSPSGKHLVFFAPHMGAELRSGNYWMVEPSTAKVDFISHDGVALASQRARAGAQWPERPVWLGESIAVYGRLTPGQPGSLTLEDIKGNAIVDPRVQVASGSAHWFVLTPKSAPRDLTVGFCDVSPVPVIASGATFAVIGDKRIWRLRESGTPSLLFPTSPPLLDFLSGQSFFGQVRSNGGGGFFPVAGAAGTLAQVSLQNGSPALKMLHTPLDSTVLAVSGSGVALSQVGYGKGAELALMRPDGRITKLGKINPFLDQVAETHWINFNYSNAEGAERMQLSGCLLLPSDYQPDRKYPLIVEVYPDQSGGCASPAVRNRFAMASRIPSYSEHLLAARGFIVFRPDIGGGIARTADGPQAAMSAVVDRGIDAAVAAGYGDANRIGLLGFSQGGFASLWVATQSRRYKAVVSLNGWSDLVSSFFGMDWSQELVPAEMPPQGALDRYLPSAGTPFSMGGTPWQFPQRYIDNSPLWHSNAVSAPVLLIHSDMDEFDDDDYKSFFSSLYIQKKDARLLIYRGEGHSPSSPANIRDMWQNIFFWFDCYLNVSRDRKGKMLF